MYYYRNGRASVSVNWPCAFAVCDRCGFLYNHKDLIWQNQWVGPRLQNLMILVCEDCLDKPQEQLRTLLIPADPIPIDTPRPADYSSMVPSYLGTLDGSILVTDSGERLVNQIETTPTPDPNQPFLEPEEWQT